MPCHNRDSAGVSAEKRVVRAKASISLSRWKEAWQVPANALVPCMHLYPSPSYAHGPGAKTKEPPYIFPRSVSVSGALDVRSAHTRPTGMCLAYWSVSRGPNACELRLLQVLCASAGRGRVRHTTKSPFVSFSGGTTPFFHIVWACILRQTRECFVQFF